MPKAIFVTPQNTKYIIDYAAALDMNLSDLPDNLWSNSQDGFSTYVITDGTKELNNVTFTTMTHTSFEQYWKFADTFCADYFVEIVKK
jgi:hypothetical protein